MTQTSVPPHGAPNPKPAAAELILLRHIWHDKRLSAREVHDRSVDQTSWAYSTTRKTLDRMVDKGLLKVEPVHGIKTFIATQSKLKTLAGLITDFTRNVLDAHEPLPAATFMNSRLIGRSEIAELEALLDELDPSSPAQTKGNKK